jgi:hypothetical protein
VDSPLNLNEIYNISFWLFRSLLVNGRVHTIIARSVFCDAAIQRFTFALLQVENVMSKIYAVYIMANQPKGTLYTGGHQRFGETDLSA